MQEDLLNEYLDTLDEWGITTTEYNVLPNGQVETFVAEKYADLVLARCSVCEEVFEKDDMYMGFCEDCAEEIDINLSNEVVT